MKNFQMWALVFVTAIAVILAVILITREDPKPDTDQIEYERRISKILHKLDSSNRAGKQTVSEFREYILQAEKRDSMYTVERKRLLWKIRSIDFSKATDKQLDSAIIVLYGE